ncbi:MAG: N-acetylmuramic acid 6-phosphate etherase [Microcella sp.]|uniref:N-acetylmuramic acid 6-phosphate etherase n=1 Tax=Microcella sp. TaxID=1913979 RepID=UPI0024C9B4BB|nr:N-acetylmuramic acid 6-phosphate etherase [Microcella sp.]UYN83224.1 MAG: N-acetylmuramic acid 6-phosphate etherase [Microcella sp.]
MNPTLASGENPSALPGTEQRNPRSTRLDEMSSIEIVRLLNAEDLHAIEAVGAAAESLAALVDDAESIVRAGGNVHYFGAGTSGRLGVLDAAELIPTFGIEPTLVRARIAGGDEAIVNAVEGSEDSADDGVRDALEQVREGDLVIGLTVSGTTPYVEGALRCARECGARTALVTSNPEAAIAPLADHVIVADTGPEVLTGSTRLKAGTATKVILNGFSTALMVRLGRTYSNLMVAVVPGNKKLRERTLRILHEVNGASTEHNAQLIDEAGGDLRVAVVAAATGATAALARDSLLDSGGSVRDAIVALTRGS